VNGRLLGWKRGFEGSRPAAELSFDGEGVVSVFKANVGVSKFLPRSLTVTYPQDHTLTIKLPRPVTGDVVEIDAGGG
jgi:hypothetical protein